MNQSKEFGVNSVAEGATILKNFEDDKSSTEFVGTDTSANIIHVSKQHNHDTQ